MKKILVLLVSIICGFSSVQALELDAEAIFTGNQPAGFFYYGINQKYDLVLGLGASIPGTKYKNGTGSELDLDINLGLRTNVVLIGEADLYFVFDNRDGVSRTGTYEKSDFYTKSFVVSKTWAYRVADRVNIGVRIPLVEVLIDGQKQVNVLQGLYPVLATTINF